MNFFLMNSLLAFSIFQVKSIDDLIVYFIQQLKNYNIKMMSTQELGQQQNIHQEAIKFLQTFEQKLSSFIAIPSIILLQAVNIMSQGQFLDQLLPITNCVSVFHIVSKFSNDSATKGINIFHSMKYTPKFISSFNLQNAAPILQQLYFDSQNIMTDFFGSLVTGLQQIRLEMEEKLYTLQKQTQNLLKQSLKITIAKATSQIPCLLNKLKSMKRILQKVESLFNSLIPGGALLSQMAFFVTFFSEIFLNGILCELHMKIRLDQLSFIISPQISHQNVDVIACDEEIRSTFQICWKKILSLLTHNIHTWTLEEHNKIINLADSNLKQYYLVKFHQQLENIPKIIQSNINQNLKQQILLMMYANEDLSDSFMFIDFVKNQETIFLNSMKDLQQSARNMFYKAKTGMTTATKFVEDDQQVKKSISAVKTYDSQKMSITELAAVQSEMGNFAQPIIINQNKVNSSTSSVVQNIGLSLSQVPNESKIPYMNAICDVGQTSRGIAQQFLKAKDFGIGRQIKIGVDDSKSKSEVGKTYNNTVLTAPINLMTQYTKKLPQKHQVRKINMIITNGSAYVSRKEFENYDPKIGQQIGKMLISDPKQEANSLNQILESQPKQQATEKIEVPKIYNSQMDDEVEKKIVLKKGLRIILSKFGLQRRQILKNSQKAKQIIQYLQSLQKNRVSDIQKLKNFISLQIKGIRGYIQNRSIFMEQRVEELKKEIPQIVQNANQMLMNQLKRSILDEIKTNLGSFAADVKIKDRNDLDAKINFFVEQMKKVRVINQQDLGKYFTKLEKMATQTDIYLKSTLGTILTTVQGTVKQFQQIMSGNEDTLIKLFNQRIGNVQNSISSLSSQNSISSKKILNSLVMGIDMLKNMTIKMRQNHSEINESFERNTSQISNLSNQMNQIQQYLKKTQETYQSMLGKNQQNIIQNIQKAQQQNQRLYQNNNSYQSKMLQEQKLANKNLISIATDNVSAFDKVTKQLKSSESKYEKSADMIANSIMVAEQNFSQIQDELKNLQSFNLRNFNQLQYDNNVNAYYLNQGINENKSILTQNTSYLESTIQKCNTIIEKLYEKDSNVINLIAITQSLNHEIKTKFPLYQNHFVKTQDVMIQLSRQIQLSSINQNQGFSILGNMITSVNSQAVGHISSKMDNSFNIMFSGMQNSQMNIVKKIDELGANQQQMTEIKSKVDNLQSQKTKLLSQLTQQKSLSSKLSTQRGSSLKNLISLCRLLRIEADSSDDVQILARKALESLQKLQGIRLTLQGSYTNFDLSSFDKICLKLNEIVPEKMKIQQTYNNLLKVQKQLEGKSNEIQKQIIKNHTQKMENQKTIQTLALQKEKAQLYTKLMELIGNFMTFAPTSNDIFSLLNRSEVSQWNSFVAILKKTIESNLQKQLNKISKEHEKKEEQLRKRISQIQNSQRRQMDKSNLSESNINNLNNQILDLKRRISEQQAKNVGLEHKVKVTSDNFFKRRDQIEEHQENAKKNKYKLQQLQKQQARIELQLVTQRSKVKEYYQMLQQTKAKLRNSQKVNQQANQAIDQLKKSQKLLSDNQVEHLQLFKQLKDVTLKTTGSTIVAQIKKQFEQAKLSKSQLAEAQAKFQKLKKQIKQQRLQFEKTKQKAQLSQLKIKQLELKVTTAKQQMERKLKESQMKYQTKKMQKQQEHNQSMLNKDLQKAIKSNQQARKQILLKEKTIIQMQNRFLAKQIDETKYKTLLEQQTQKLKQIQKNYEDQKKNFKELKQKHEVMKTEINEKQAVLNDLVLKLRNDVQKSVSFESQIMKKLNQLNINKYLINMVKSHVMDSKLISEKTVQTKIKQMIQNIKLILQQELKTQQVMKAIKGGLLQFGYNISQDKFLQQIKMIMPQLHQKLLLSQQKLVETEASLKQSKSEMQLMKKKFEKQLNQQKQKAIECQKSLADKQNVISANTILISNLQSIRDEKISQIQKLKLQIEDLKNQVEKQSNFKDFKQLIDRLAVQMCTPDENVIQVLKQIFKSISQNKIPQNVTAEQLTEMIINQNSSAVFLRRLRQTVRKKAGFEQFEDVKKQQEQFLLQQKQRKQRQKKIQGLLQQRDKDIHLILNILDLYERTFIQIFQSLNSLKMFFKQSVQQFEAYINRGKGKGKNAAKYQAFVKVMEFFQQVLNVIKDLSSMVPIEQFIDKYHQIPKILQRASSGLPIGFERVKRIIDNFNKV